MTAEASKKRRVVMPWMRKRKTRQLEEREISVSPMFKWLTKRSDKNVRKARLLWGREFNIVKKGLDEEQVVAFVDDLIAEHKASQEASAASPRSVLETTVTDAEQMAPSIKMKAQQEAEAEAERIINQAKQEAKRIKEAEQLAASIKMKAQQEAEAEAERIINQAKQEAKRIRRSAKVAAQKEATGKEIEEPTQLQEEAIEEKTEPPAQLQEEAPVSEPVEAATEELLEQHPAEERPGTKKTKSAHPKLDSQDLYAGQVELIVASPVELKLVSRLYNYLQTVPELRILYTRGSWDQGTTITIVLDKPLPLIDIILKTPGVEVTPELVEKDALVRGKSSSLLRGGEKRAKSIRLVLKEA